MRRKVLLLFYFFYSIMTFSQNSQPEILRFQRAWGELCQLQESSSADILIEKGKKVISIYENLISADSTLAEQYLLYLPYRCIAYGYEKKEDYVNASTYYGNATYIAANYTKQLGKLGLTTEGYISLLEALRDTYAKSKKEAQAIDVAKDIVKGCEQAMPTMAAYEQMCLWSIYENMGNKEEALDAAKQSLNLYEHYGNSITGFHITTPLSKVLLNLLEQKRYDDMLNFMDVHRNNVNSLLGGKDSTELKELALNNQYIYHAYMGLQKYRKAVNAATLVANYYKEANNGYSTEHAIWLHNIACAYLGIYQTENTDTALAKANTLLTYTEDIWNRNLNKETDNHYATFLGTKGVYLSYIGQQNKAGQCYVQSLNIHQKNHFYEDGIQKDLERLTTFYRETNRIDDAINLYSSLLGRYNQLNDSLNMAEINKQLSIIFADKLHDYKQAEKYAMASYTILKKCAPMSLNFAYAESNLATIYSKIGLSERAAELRLNSIHLKSTLTVVASEDMLDIYSDFVDAYSSVLEYYPDTLKWFTDQAVPFCKNLVEDSSTDIENRISSLKLLAKINMFTKNYSEAEIQFEECAKLEEEKYGKKSENYLTTLNNLSYTCLLAGQYSKCRTIIEKIIRYNSSKDNFHNYENLLGIAIFSKDSLLAESALKKLYDSETDYICSHFIFMSSEQRNEFIDENTGVGRLVLPSLYFPNNDVCAQYAYNSALFSKGLLMNTVRGIETIAASSNNHNVKILYDELLRVRRRLEETNNSNSVDEIVAHKEEIEKKLLAEIGVDNDISKILKTNWKDVRCALTEHEVAVEFFTVDNSVLRAGNETEYYGAAILKKNWDSPKVVKLSSKDETDKLAKRIIDTFNHGSVLSTSQWNYISKQLYRKIWEPLMSHINKGDTICFSPAAMLCLIPLEALTCTDGVSICDKYNLRRLSSTREICHKEQSCEKNNAVLFGGLTYTDPHDAEQLHKSGKERQGWQELPATATEVESIAHKMSKNGINVKLFEQMDGTEKVFNGLSGQNCAYLHIATHGFYFNDMESNTLAFLKNVNVTPNKEQHITALKRTGLMLSGGQSAWLGLKKTGTDDGILLSSEISALDFHKVQLVVLSACQTGLGDISDDGIVGLQRAFKMSGVQSLIMTLWKVDDNATAYMMDNFYTQLMQGKSKRQAFNIAKEMVREEFKEPFYWAPFILLD